jgi:hypothetical protein
MSSHETMAEFKNRLKMEMTSAKFISSKGRKATLQAMSTSPNGVAYLNLEQSGTTITVPKSQFKPAQNNESQTTQS